MNTAIVPSLGSLFLAKIERRYIDLNTAYVTLNFRELLTLHLGCSRSSVTTIVDQPFQPCKVIWTRRSSNNGL